ncbi:hypothetical protein GDO81_008495 [Engystomops pustulosus]|uniref:Uncharacterized protein n=1 Tax=Engystomops pustulosus TaxID=76066 RepID=A0AAV7CF37_ENGPU|nr:hypothetical protein GDO81_008495 [Engystomops pustulosus]
MKINRTESDTAGGWQEELSDLSVVAKRSDALFCFVHNHNSTLIYFWHLLSSANVTLLFFTLTSPNTALCIADPTIHYMIIQYRKY